MKATLLCAVILAFSLCGLSPVTRAQWVQTSLKSGCRANCILVSGTDLYVGTAGNWAFRSTDNGATWTQVHEGIVWPYIITLFVSGTNLFAGISYGDVANLNLVFVSSDSGSTWREASTGLSGSALCNAFAVIGRDLYAGTMVGVYLSTNNGDTWTEVDSGMTNQSVSSLAVSGGNLFAGTFGKGVYLSTNNGTTWSSISNSLPYLDVASLAIVGTRVVVGTGEGLFVSTNNGTNWSATGSDSMGLLVHALAVNGTNIFAGIWGRGVFLSTDLGVSWKAVNTGLPDLHVWSLAANSTNLFAGTFDNLVWRRPISEMITSIKISSPQPPIEFGLEQNYPNPFNPTTTIRYALPERSHVTLTVFNSLGQQVALLVNDNQEPGYHEVKFNAANFASGVYFYHILAGSFVQTKKLILLR